MIWGNFFLVSIPLLPHEHRSPTTIQSTQNPKLQTQLIECLICLMVVFCAGCLLSIFVVELINQSLLHRYKISETKSLIPIIVFAVHHPLAFPASLQHLSFPHLASPVVPHLAVPLAPLSLFVPAPVLLRLLDSSTVTPPAFPQPRNLIMHRHPSPSLRELHLRISRWIEVIHSVRLIQMLIQNEKLNSIQEEVPKKRQ